MSLKLPIHQIIPELRDRLAAGPAVILTAPPGSGKTTVTPIALLNEPWLMGRRILMLEPRRLAARLAATFMARQLGEEVGQTVGYRVRFDSRVSAATRVEVVTEGILTRRLQNEPELGGIGLVIFDEFHERSLQADLALALCLDVMNGLRDDLKIMVMSATLNSAALSTLLEQAPVVHAAGFSHPVAIEYRAPSPGPEAGPEAGIPRVREIAGQVASAVVRILAEQPGDILAFLPGAAEIRHCRNLLADRLAGGTVVIHPLYGDLSLDAQTAAVLPDPAGRRRVILATPIAETSITIEGVHSVVDSGWQRRPRFDPNSGLNRLVTQRISQAAATQRAGRAGRLGPGHCLRLWSAHEHRGLRPFDPPEILSADLSGLLLELTCWGITDPTTLRWPDPPPAANLIQAAELLQALGALDEKGMVTALGRRINDLPVHPRLGLMLLKAHPGLLTVACDLAALLGERDISKGRERSVDIEERLHVLAVFRRDGAAAVRALAADPEACRRVLQVSGQLREQLATTEVKPKEQPGSTGLAGELLAPAFPDRIGLGRPGRRGRYKLSSGRGAALPSHDPLADQQYLVVPELDAGRSEGRIFLAAALTGDGLRSIFADRLQYREEVFWDRRTAAVKSHRLTMLGDLVLEEDLLTDPDPDKIAQALLAAIRDQGLELLPWNEQARELQARIAAARHWQPEADWPEVSDQYLHRHPEKWLAPWLGGIKSAEQLRRLNLMEILAAMLSWPQRNYLEREVPSHLTVPSGSKRKLGYRPGEPPVLAVRVQEMFGLADTPKIVEGRVPVLLHLLSPAGRPVQITTDLRGFWGNAYQEVKRELQGRYPKHHWPDDPWQAKPTARVKPRR